MLLAADIGGTKALLALYGEEAPRFERRYACREFASFAALLERFRADAHAALGAPPRIARACLGVAGPVSATRAELTNLAWQIDARDLGIPAVRMLNDFEASVHGLAALGADDLATLQAGAPRAAAFAPADELEDRLWRHLRRALGRVELEHAISGPGLARIYAFLRDTGATPSAVATLAPDAEDAALAIALAALDLFIACYGAAAGDYALAVLARGGVYVAGGIAPRILPRLRTGGFLAAFNAKGAFAGQARACPVHVVTNERLGLIGAAAAAPS